ncbi:hypothetical protein EG028_02155 [Chitinophaga barathri]|uniref:MobA/VirD2-like nuclease domain-containing protein n=1 Tax=Chitinophaga barathri TaxID=1647451 RepID=A0A3N4MU82_9BACT|nr:hypothetical protein EG028_02155 [Chitinophaga barathri]
MIYGCDLDGLIRYNEAKVQEGTGICLEASGFGADPDALNALQKSRRFQKITSLNAGAMRNAVHFVLSFPPEEMLSPERMIEIAQRYIDLVGYGDQPALIYQHTDTAHPHLHIVTTNIRRDGTQMPEDWFIRDVAEPARKQIEDEFALIKAEGRGQRQGEQNLSLDAEALRYGHQETKRAISNIVRMVIAQYKFASLGDFNAVLRQYNIMADPGESGSKRRDVDGLVYSMLGPHGEKVGRQVNASAIHERPTMKVLRQIFSVKEEQRERFRGRVTRIVSDAVRSCSSLESFCDEIGRFGIKAHFHRGKNDRIFGLTFIDTHTRVVFSGSDLRKDLGAAAVLRKLSPPQTPDTAFNGVYVRNVIARTDFRRTPQSILKAWAEQGLFIHVSQGKDGKSQYWMGRVDTPTDAYVRMPPRVRAWLATMAGAPSKARHRTPQPTTGIARALERFGRQQIRAGWQEIVKGTQDALDYTYTSNYTPHHFLTKKKKKKRQRRL